MKWITEAKHIKNFEIKVTFNDKKTAIIDFAGLLTGEIFEPLKDQSYFTKFTIHPDLEVITWPNCADFSPEYLYEIAENQSKVS